MIKHTKRLPWLRTLICSASVFLFSAAASAHDASLTLVQSGKTSLELTFSLEPVQTLHAILATDLDIFSFLKRYSEMPLSDFSSALFVVEAQLSHDVTLDTGDGQVLVLKDWHWPNAADQQAYLQQQVDQVLKGPTQPLQLVPLDVTAHAESKIPLNRVRISIRQPIRPIFLIRPGIEQFWIDDMAPDAILDF